MTARFLEGGVAPPAGRFRLTARQLERYARPLLLPEIGVAGQERLAASRVLVVGLGGLGCPASTYLAAAGVGTLGLMDGDQVELSNLPRQVLYRPEDLGRSKAASAGRSLLELNPEVHLVTHSGRLTATNALEVVRGYHVVVAACDNHAARYVLNDACVRASRPLVDASVRRFEGRLALYCPGSGCLRCLFPLPPEADEVGGLAAMQGILGPLPGIMGCLEALEVLKVLLGLGRPLSDRLLLFNGLTGEQRLLKRTRNPACPVCGDRPTPARRPEDQIFAGSEPQARRPAMQRTEILEIAPEEAWREMQARPEIQVVDVRDPESYLACHVPGARSIPLAGLPRRVGELDSSRPVYVICMKGKRSLEGAQLLLEQGFSEVFTVARGTEGWKDLGLPLES
jgi:adenylyltransferase/sulfurtransferase